MPCRAYVVIDRLFSFHIRGDEVKKDLLCTHTIIKIILLLSHGFGLPAAARIEFVLQ